MNTPEDTVLWAINHIMPCSIDVEAKFAICDKTGLEPHEVQAAIDRIPNHELLQAMDGEWRQDDSSVGQQYSL